MTGKPEVINSSVGLAATNALVLTALANLRVVGKRELILGLDLFDWRVVNARLFCAGLSETDPPPGPLPD